MGQPTVDVARVLEGELRGLLRNSNPWIQLSAVFSLALLHVDDIGVIVDNALRTNADWSNSQDLVTWIRRVGAGSTSYPSLDLG